MSNRIASTSIAVAAAAFALESRAFAQYVFPLDASDCAAVGYCQITAHVDHGSGVVYNCETSFPMRRGAATYSGHQGTDFAITGAVRDTTPRTNLCPRYLNQPYYQITAIPDVRVLAAADGHVAEIPTVGCNHFCSTGCCSCGGGYGNTILVEDVFGNKVRYMHLKQNSVPMLLRRVGAVVRTGDVLGLVGSSGYSTGPHLHFEVSTATVVSMGLEDRVVDPFAGPCNTSMNSNTAYTLWNVDQGIFGELPRTPAFTCARRPGEFTTGVRLPTIMDPDLSSRPFVEAYGRATRNPLRAVRASPIDHPLGCPPDASAMHPIPLVHEIPTNSIDMDGRVRAAEESVWLQDFYQADAALRWSTIPMMPTDGETALVLNRRLRHAFLVRSGFWGVYRCMRWNGNPVGGAEYLGAPRSEEYVAALSDAQRLGVAVGVTVQEFERGYLTFTNNPSATVNIHFYRAEPRVILPPFPWTASIFTAGLNPLQDCVNTSNAGAPPVVVAHNPPVAPSPLLRPVVRAVVPHPMPVVVGDRIDESGSGFTPNGSARLHFRYPGRSTPEVPIRSWVDGAGAFPHSYQTNANTEIGRYEYWAIDEPSEMQNAARARSPTVQFEIVPGSPVVVAPAAGVLVTDTGAAQFRWLRPTGQGVDRYRLRFCQDRGMSIGCLGALVVFSDATSLVPLVNGMFARTWWWTVAAGGGSGQVVWGMESASRDLVVVGTSLMADGGIASRDAFPGAHDGSEQPDSNGIPDGGTQDAALSDVGPPDSGCQSCNGGTCGVTFDCNISCGGSCWSASSTPFSCSSTPRFLCEDTSPGTCAMSCPLGSPCLLGQCRQLCDPLTLLPCSSTEVCAFLGSDSQAVCAPASTNLLDGDPAPDSWTGWNACQRGLIRVSAGTTQCRRPCMVTDLRHCDTAHGETCTTRGGTPYGYCSDCSRSCSSVTNSCGHRVCGTLCNGAAGTCDAGTTCSGDAGCQPIPEVCNGLDDDSDGLVDEDFDCIQGSAPRPCPTGGAQECLNNCQLADCPIPPTDAGAHSDAAADVGPRDTGVHSDAALAPDLGVPDSGVFPDAADSGIHADATSPPDLGARDVGALADAAPDAAPADLGIYADAAADVGPRDTGVHPDAAPPPDLGVPDSGVFADATPPADTGIHADAAVLDAGPSSEICDGLDNDLDCQIDEDGCSNLVGNGTFDLSIAGWHQHSDPGFSAMPPIREVADTCNSSPAVRLEVIAVGTGDPECGGQPCPRHVGFHYPSIALHHGARIRVAFRIRSDVSRMVEFALAQLCGPDCGAPQTCLSTPLTSDFGNGQFGAGQCGWRPYGGPPVAIPVTQGWQSVVHEFVVDLGTAAQLNEARNDGRISFYYGNAPGVVWIDEVRVEELPIVPTPPEPTEICDGFDNNADCRIDIGCTSRLASGEGDFENGIGGVTTYEDAAAGYALLASASGGACDGGGVLRLQVTAPVSPDAWRAEARYLNVPVTNGERVRVTFRARVSAGSVPYLDLGVRQHCGAACGGPVCPTACPVSAGCCFDDYGGSARLALTTTWQTYSVAFPIVFPDATMSGVMRPDGKVMFMVGSGTGVVLVDNVRVFDDVAVP